MSVVLAKCYLGHFAKQPIVMLAVVIRHDDPYVYLKIRPMSYFHQGNITSIRRNLNTLPKKLDIEGVFDRIFTM